MEKDMSGGKEKVQVVLSDDADVVVVRGGTRVEFNGGGGIDVYGDVHVMMHPPANDTAAPEIGAVALAGDHKGEIYGGIYPADKKPIWFSAAPKSMDHFNAASWATEQGGALPTRKQGDYLTTLKDKGGAFTELFNRGGSFPAGYVWLAEPGTGNRDDAWCQRLGFGDQGVFHRNLELPVLSVRR
jgi:hypothetical protein